MRSAMLGLRYRHSLSHSNSNSCKWWSLCHWSQSLCWAAQPQAWCTVPWKDSSKSPTGFERWEQLIICHHQEVFLMVLSLNNLYPEEISFCLLVLVKLTKTLLLLLRVMAIDKTSSLKRECSWPVPPNHYKWKTLFFSKLEKHFALAKF